MICILKRGSIFFYFFFLLIGTLFEGRRKSIFVALVTG